MKLKVLKVNNRDSATMAAPPKGNPSRCKTTVAVAARTTPRHGNENNTDTPGRAFGSVAPMVRWFCVRSLDENGGRG